MKNEQKNKTRNHHAMAAGSIDCDVHVTAVEVSFIILACRREFHRKQRFKMTAPKKPITKYCAECARPLPEKRRSNMRFCSSYCRVTAWRWKGMDQEIEDDDNLADYEDIPLF